MLFEHNEDGTFTTTTKHPCNDGRIVAFTEKSIHLLNRDGREIGRYDDSAKLMNDLAGARPVNRPIDLGATSFRFGTSTLNGIEDQESFLSTVINIQSRTQSKVYTKIAGNQSLGEGTFHDRDRTLNWKSTMSGESAFAQMGIKNAGDFQNLLAHALNLDMASDLALAGSYSLPFATGDVSLSATKLQVRLANGSGGVSESRISPPENSRWLTALPVVTGKHSYLFAATDRGMIYWYDMGNRVAKRIAIFFPVISGRYHRKSPLGKGSHTWLN